MSQIKKTPYNPGDIIEIPFPYLGEPDEKSRAAVVISNTEFNKIFPAIWCVKITTKPKGNLTEIKLTGQERSLCGLVDDSVIDSGVLFAIPKKKITNFYGSLTMNKFGILLISIKKILPQ